MTILEANNITSYRIALLFCLMVVLTACGGDNGANAPQSTAGTDMLTDDEIARYEKKVSGKVGASMANMMVKDWGISRDQAECLLLCLWRYSASTVGT
jgi:hypothetical protein